MPRIIGENIKNQLIIRDPVSGSEITIYYRMPTPIERIAYEMTKYKKEGDEIKISFSEAGQIFGEKIIEGFSEGAFVHKVGDEFKSFSSDPQSQGFDPEWKTLLKQYAPDILETLAFHVFEGMRTIGTQSPGDNRKN